ncbi:MAG: hypothetical protein FJ144_20715 [Deltaproteobacteria bacterium]|nr:hypothetical protein [Deltaproteobacteria bacterium]
MSKRKPVEETESKASRVEVGAHVDASCGKCKSVTSHIVIAKIDATPTRVECRVCAAVHAYRAPRRVVKTAPTPRAESRTPEAIWQDAMKRARGAAVPYSTRENYAVGARLTHASFGDGVVTRLSSPTVCEVVFETGAVKLLMRELRGT